jgi:glycosyltransferase involved in cell wall biosynthesis
MPDVAVNNSPTISVAILTYNEERRLPRCLAGVAFADEVVVVDSGSTDRTIEIAQSSGAKVYSYPDWQGFAVQRNRLLQNCSCDYVFFLDADEELTPDFAKELTHFTNQGLQEVRHIVWEQVAFGRRLGAMGRGGSIARLFPRNLLLSYEGLVHERAVLSQEIPTGVFKNRVIHHSRETVHGSLLKLAQYSQLGATKRAQVGKRGGVVRGMASAIANFVRLYIFQRGFLCGPEGFLHCFLISLECFFRYAAIPYDANMTQTPAKR